MEQYIRMNRGINGGQDLPKICLSQIYDDIASNAIKMRVIPCVRPGRQGQWDGLSAADRVSGVACLRRT